MACLLKGNYFLVKAEGDSEENHGSFRQVEKVYIQAVSQWVKKKVQIIKENRGSLLKYLEKLPLFYIHLCVSQQRKLTSRHHIAVFNDIVKGVISVTTSFKIKMFANSTF